MCKSLTAGLPNHQNASILLLFIFPQRNSNTIYQLRQEISSLRAKIEEYGKNQMKWEIVRELGGHSGGGKGT